MFFHFHLNTLKNRFQFDFSVMTEKALNDENIISKSTDGPCSKAQAVSLISEKEYLYDETTFKVSRDRSHTKVEIPKFKHCSICTENKETVKVLFK